MIWRSVVIVMFAGFLALAGCAAMTEKTMKDKGLSPMTQSQLEAFHSRDRACEWVSFVGLKGSATYHVGGVAAFNPQGADRYGGNWRIAGGKFCLKLQSETQETCYTVYQTGAKEYQYFAPDGGWAGSRSYID